MKAPHFMGPAVLLLHARGLPLDITMSEINTVLIFKLHFYSAQFNIDLPIYTKASSSL
jgi:hypothetical protein